MLNIFSLAAVAMTMSCASYMSMTDNWKAPSYHGPAYKRITIVSLAERPQLRQALENELAGKLKAHAVEAAACSQCIPDADHVTGEDLANIGGESETGAYLIIRLLGVETRIESFRAEDPDPMQEEAGYRGLYLEIPEPPLEKRTEVATLELRLLDGKTSMLVWRSTVDAVNLSGSKNHISRFSTLVVKALSENKLIPELSRT